MFLKRLRNRPAAVLQRRYREYIFLHRLYRRTAGAHFLDVRQTLQGPTRDASQSCTIA